MISYLLFDLDNTLYPSTSKIDHGITTRMIQFIADHLHISFDEAENLRKKELPKYGTTLEWLRSSENLTDTDAYFDCVHPASELQELPELPHLRELMLSFNRPMSLLTNSPLRHAQRVIEFYNIQDLFLHIFDIEKNNLRGKPYPDAYTSALEISGFTMDKTLFVDDHLKYIKGYSEIGGKAVLIDDKKHYTPEQIEKTSPYAVIYKLEELSNLL